MPFKDPGSTTSLPLDDLDGSLLYVDVHEQLDEIETVHGPSRPISADVFVLDGAHKGDEYVDVLIFPRVLISQLRSAVGEVVLGRLGKGVGKAGKNPPWQLATATPADRAIGERFETHHAERTAATTPLDDEEPF